MKAYDAQITRKNIKNYFKQTGLTMDAFANLLGISKRWLEYVFSEENDYEFDPNTVQKACDFFIVNFGRFTTTLMSPPNNLREILQIKHLRNTEYSKLLNDEPSLPFIIDNVLVKDSEFADSSGMESKDIKKIIWKHFPKISLTNLSQTLQNSEYIHCEPHASKKKTNIYKVMVSQSPPS